MKQTNNQIRYYTQLSVHNEPMSREQDCSGSHWLFLFGEIMPYTVKSKNLPANVQKMTDKQKAQWVAVWNATYAACTKKGGDTKTCEGRAFAFSNGVIKKEKKMSWKDRLIEIFRGSLEEIDPFELVEKQRPAGSATKGWDGSASNYKDTAAYCAACLVNVNSSGKDPIQGLCKLPVKSPGSSSYNKEGVHAAAVRFSTMKKPASVSAEAWSSAVKSAANKIISAYSGFGETAPAAIYTAAGKTPPKNRDISVGDIMDQLYGAMYDMEDSYNYRLTRLMFDGSSLYAIYNNKGKLMKSGISVGSDGTVSMGDMSPVMENYVEQASGQSSDQGSGKSPDQTKSRVWVKRQQDSKLHVYMVAGTSILNRVTEIDSEELFDNMARHADDSGFYPTLDFYHLGMVNEAFEVGETVFVAREGVTYIASGIIDETKTLGKRIARDLEENPGEWGCSIEYYPLDKETVKLRVADGSDLDIDVYKDGVNTRIALLPEKDAASWFTSVTVKERDLGDMNKKQLEKLRAMFETEDEFNAFISTLGEVNEEVQTRNLIHRDGEEGQAEVEATQTEEVQSKPREVEIDDAVIQMIAAQAANMLRTEGDVLGEIKASLTTLSNQFAEFAGFQET